MTTAVTTTLTHELTLPGCRPEPLLSYLKALGILRLVGEQADPSVCGFWRRDEFVLRGRLDRPGLVRFFLEAYRPTPILSPWNSAGGFFGSGAGRNALEAIAATRDPRLGSYREAISRARQAVARVASGGQKLTDVKEKLIATCRAELPDVALEWIDTAIALTGGGPQYPRLLGSGGTDGRLDFSVNFIEHLEVVISAAFGHRQPGKREQSRRLLEAALFSDREVTLDCKTAGQFDPGGGGGANLSQKFETDSLVNRWDFVLAIEGTALFAGAVVRRLAPGAQGAGAFPFTVLATESGYGTAAAREYRGKGRAQEVWVPLWDRPATRPEIKGLFAEGRLQLGRRQARSGVEAARAIATLGVERGATSFCRYVFLTRRGDAHLAVPVGRLDVTLRQPVRLIGELDEWLAQVERAAANDKAPATLVRAVGALHRAVLAACDEAGPPQMQEVLIACGRVARVVAMSAELKKNVRHSIPTLSAAWLDEADDGSATFAIAAAIASIYGVSGSDEPSAGSMRVELEPVESRGRAARWRTNSSGLLPRARPTDLLVGLLERRVLAAGRANLAHIPLAARHVATLGQVLDFLAGRTDDERILDLMLPLSCVEWPSGPASRLLASVPPAFPRAYALLKLLFLPQALKAPGATEAVAIRAEGSLLPLLRAGRAREALSVAARRLAASGLQPLASDYVLSPEGCARLAAALLIPIPDAAALAGLVLERPGRKPGEQQRR